ncbi:MAG: hypothetical protein R3F11_25550 [Verrucomicrobiales bacterium]
MIHHPSPIAKKILFVGFLVLLVIVLLWVRDSKGQEFGTGDAEIEALRSQFHEEAKAARRPLHDAYLKRLREIRKKLSDSGNDPAAEKVGEEIDRILEKLEEDAETIPEPPEGEAPAPASDPAPATGGDAPMIEDGGIPAGGIVLTAKAAEPAGLARYNKEIGAVDQWLAAGSGAIWKNPVPAGQYYVDVLYSMPETAAGGTAIFAFGEKKYEVPFAAERATGGWEKFEWTRLGVFTLDGAADSVMVTSAKTKITGVIAIKEMRILDSDNAGDPPQPKSDSESIEGGGFFQD